jgi:nascent polypeptide-associated complex subunit alpha
MAGLKRLSPRELRRAQERMLKNLGLDVEEMGCAEEAVIKFPGKTLTIRGPSVFVLKTGGEKVVQLVGGEVVEEKAVDEVPAYTPVEEDVLLVASQAGVSEEEARQALVEAGGDLAKAILYLRSRR